MRPAEMLAEAGQFKCVEASFEGVQQHQAQVQGSCIESLPLDTKCGSHNIEGST